MRDRIGKMPRKVVITVHRFPPNTDLPVIDKAEMYFPSFTAAASFMTRLGFVFANWNLDDEQLKFKNPATEEVAYLNPMEDQL